MIGEHLRELRKECGWTLSDLSLKTDLSISYLSDIECGRSLGNMRTLETIAKAFDMTPSAFLGYVSEELTVRERELLAAFRAGDLETVVRLTLEHGGKRAGTGKRK